MRPGSGGVGRNGGLRPHRDDLPGREDRVRRIVGGRQQQGRDGDFRRDRDAEQLLGDLSGSRTRPLVLTWAFMRLARTR
jgi:hypothetical protein